MNRRTVLFLGRFAVLTAVVLAVLQSGENLLADQTVRKKPMNCSVVFNRPIKKAVGRGGFAYQGMRQAYTIEDYLLASVDNAPKESPWFASEKALYRNQLKQLSYDMLVVPFQTQLDGVDPVGRSIMSYRLALEIERRTNLRVAPMPLVHLALGSHARFYHDSDVYALARDLGASTIIWGFAGTREDDVGHLQSLDITMICQHKADFGTPQGSRRKSWEKIDLQPNRLPSLLFEDRLDEVMAFLDLPENGSDTNLETERKQILAIPKTPEAFLNAEPRDAVDRCRLFQFMGMLTPTRAEFHRDYMFIRSLTALADVSPRHPEYPVLKARAYHYLHRRPAALEVLKEDQSNSANFLREIINGNLPPLEKAYARLEHSMDMDTLFATLEYAWLMYRYTGQYPQQHIDRLFGQLPEWRYFFEIVLRDRDGWSVPSNVTLKQYLDRYFPIQGFALEDIVSAALHSQETDTIDAVITMAFGEHVRKCIDTLPDATRDAAGPSLLDHLWMHEGIGISNLVKNIRFLLYVQCLPREAMELCRDYLKTFEGNPYVTLLYATSVKKIAPKLQGAEREQAKREAVENAVLGFWWYGRQGWAFAPARLIFRAQYLSDVELLNNIVPSKILLFGVGSDYPFLPECAREGWMRPYEDLIDWSSCDISDVLQITTFYRLNNEKLALAEKKAQGRFLGHPDRHKFEISMGCLLHGDEDPKKPYIDLIEQGSRVWNVYCKLGDMYTAEGDFKKAQEVFLRYPAFKDGQGENRVALSNHAYRAGSTLFWKGAYNEARPLYEYSAGLDTGSGGSLASAACIALLDLDLNTAADYMLRSARRYDDVDDYSDFMSVSHMLGDSQTAWKQFEALLGRFSDPSIWTSALVGHRIAQTGPQELREWIAAMASLNQTSRQRSFPARFAMLCLTDRAPNMDMAKFVSDVDDLTKYDMSKKFMIKGPDGAILGPDPFGLMFYTDLCDPNTGIFKSPEDAKVLKKRYYEEDVPEKPFSFYGSFAAAYEKIKQTAFSEAYDLLKRQSLVYGYSMDLGKSAKVYLVWSGLKSGNTQEIGRLLHGELFQAGLIQNPGMPNPKEIEFCFDDELALAAHQCFMGNHDVALEYMQKAFVKRPSTGKRPLYTWYQMVELCEWFYEHSRDKRYIDLAMRWSQDHQIIRPMFGWAFAFEAKHTDDVDRRRRALGYTLYLDPQSWRISHFSESEKQRAREWFNAHNPFKRKTPSYAASVIWDKFPFLYNFIQYLRTLLR
jgi:tetratricopeptide (TPR) repeat protein